MQIDISQEQSTAIRPAAPASCRNLAAFFARLPLLASSPFPFQAFPRSFSPTWVRKYRTLHANKHLARR